MVECNVLLRSPEQTVRDGLAQTAAYMDRCGAEEGHLVPFDRTEGKPWADKLFRREEPVGGGAASEIACRLVEQKRFESISEACHEGLRRLDAEQRMVDTLVGLGEQGMASGVAEGFDLDEFIDQMRVDMGSPAA